MKNTTLAILAGGEGSRMGKPKALLAIRGRPILQHVLNSIQWAGPTMLVTAPRREHPPGYEAFDTEVVDLVAGEGPMRGILTAIQNASTEMVVVSPVDMPGIGSGPLQWLVEQFAKLPWAITLFLEHEGKLQPLPAVFSARAMPMLERQLGKQIYSLKSLADLPDVHVISAPAWPAEVWTNLNSPSDLTELEK